MLSPCKRLIEVDLPIRRISEHARRESKIRFGRPAHLHIWWARRPLAACRAVICAALWPDPCDPACPDAFLSEAWHTMVEFATLARSTATASLCSPESWQRYQDFGRITQDKEGEGDRRRILLRQGLLDFVADFSSWGAGFDAAFISAARRLTQAAHSSLSNAGGPRPLVIDPFAGGGAIPIEALRVGADCIAVELNPLAALLTRIMTQHVPRHGAALVAEVRKWATWIAREARARLEPFLGKPPAGYQLVGYLWARTIQCEGPNCGREVPIIKSLTISTRRSHESALRLIYDSSIPKVEVVHGKEASRIKGGTSRKSSVTCPVCGYTTRRKRVEAQGNGRGFGSLLLATCHVTESGERVYRSPESADFQAIDAAEKELANWRDKSFDGISAIPKEELPYLRSIFNVRVYGIDQWCKLFTPRQLLSALVFCEATRKAGKAIGVEIQDKGLADAVYGSLMLCVSNALQYQCSIATYLTESVKSAFIQGQSLPMKFDFIEVNPFLTNLAGGFSYSVDKHISALEKATSFQYGEGTVERTSALHQVLPDDAADLLVTDPPYYDSVPYADCSDFFHVWLRRMASGLVGWDFKSELSPKVDEVVQLAERNERYREKTKEWFEDKISQALVHRRVEVRPDGIGVLVFAHKSTEAWEALIQGVLRAGWAVTASWPIFTENETRMRANASAVLGSSIHLVCRPRENPDGSLRDDAIGDWRDVLVALPQRIHQWMPRLAEEGIVGADAIFACLGPALEIFSRHSSVEKASGEKVELREYLEEVWAAVSREALSMIFEGADASGFEEDARLTAMWLWTLQATIKGEKENAEEDVDDTGEGRAERPAGYSMEYDAARKIAQGLGAHLENLDHLVEVTGETATLLSALARTTYLFGREGAPVTRGRAKKAAQITLALREDLAMGEESEPFGAGDLSGRPNPTVLDQLHQSTILFGAGRGEAVRRFLVDDGVGRNPLFWRLAQALSALYPPGSDDKRWVDGVLGRKKGLGL